MQLQTVTDLVNSLFTYYDCNMQKLDWDNKINEYVDVINDLISYDTDLDELYKKIRQDYKYRKLPTPYDIKKIISKTKTIAEVKEYIEHPDNNKCVFIFCYKNKELVRVFNYVIANNPETKRDIKKEYKRLHDIYEEVKLRILPPKTVYTNKKLFIPTEYDSDGEPLKHDIEEVA